MKKDKNNDKSKMPEAERKSNRRGRPRKEECERRKSEETYREALLEQLRSRNADTPYFQELVSELLYQREQLRKLKQLVDAGGIVTVREDRSGDRRVNVSVLLREIRETEKSILLILKELKITTDTIISDDEDDEL